MNLLLTRILLFNAKRGGECARLLISDYRSPVSISADSAKDYNFSELEKQLCERWVTAYLTEAGLVNRYVVI